MLNNWITIHNRHPKPDNLPWHIYIQDKYKDTANEIKKGDRVFFYETKGSKLIGDNNHHAGAMGIVRVGCVNGEIYKLDVSGKYIDGKTKYWSWGLPTDADNSCGFVSREKIVDILGYSRKYYFVGFNGGTGIKKIELGQAQMLLNLFEQGKR